MEAIPPDRIWRITGPEHWLLQGPTGPTLLALVRAYAGPVPPKDHGADTAGSIDKGQPTLLSKWSSVEHVLAPDTASLTRSVLPKRTPEPAAADGSADGDVLGTASDPGGMPEAIAVMLFDILAA